MLQPGCGWLSSSQDPPGGILARRGTRGWGHSRASASCLCSLQWFRGAVQCHEPAWCRGHGAALLSQLSCPTGVCRVTWRGQVLCQGHVGALPTQGEGQDTASEPAGPLLGEFPSSPAFSVAQEFRDAQGDWQMGLPPSGVSSPLPAPLGGQRSCWPVSPSPVSPQGPMVMLPMAVGWFDAAKSSWGAGPCCPCVPFPALGTHLNYT